MPRNRLLGWLVPAAALAALAALAVWGATSCRRTEQAPVREFAVPACKAHALPPARPRPPGAFGYEDWSPQTAPPLRLVRLPVQVVGALVPPSGEIVHLEGDELARWRWETAPSGERRLLLGPLPTRGGDAFRLRLRVQPGSARRLIAVPSSSERPSDWERKHRAVPFDLGGGRESLELTLDLHTLLAENWGDEEQRGDVPLRSLELVLPPGENGAFALQSVVVEGEQVRFPQRAGRLLAEQSGRLRPSLYARGGAAARVRVTLPEDAVALTWFQGGALADVRGEVRLEREDEVHVLSSSPGAAAQWRKRSAKVAEWAGEEVVLEFAATGPGVAVFGDPRVLRKSDRSRAPNVVLYLIDTLRADHLGAWSSQVHDTPHLDRMAREGVQFAFAISTSAWTKPAIPTLMTGLRPTTHGVGSVSYADRLPATVETLQDRLAEAGWRTGSFSASPLGSTLSGLEQGFDLVVPPVFWSGKLGDLGHPSAAQVQAQLQAFFAEDPQTPFFAYVHTLEPHLWNEARFASPAPGRTAYDDAIHEQDLRIGELRKWLESEGLADDTLVVVLSDHGESFGDHGLRRHGNGLFQSQIHIPLILWAGDALPPLTVSEPVSLTDVAPTVLDLLGVPALEEIDGVSLRPYIDGDSAPLRQEVTASRIRYVWAPRAPRIDALITRRAEKLMRQAGTELDFDLGRDLCEERSSGRVPPETREALDAFLREADRRGQEFRRAHEARAGGVDASDIGLLRSLGYVE